MRVTATTPPSTEGKGEGGMTTATSPPSIEGQVERGKRDAGHKFSTVTVVMGIGVVLGVLTWRWWYWRGGSVLGGLKRWRKRDTQSGKGERGKGAQAPILYL